MRIIDSPGVVFDEDDYDDGKGVNKKGSVLLRNVVKVEDVEDPIAIGEHTQDRSFHFSVVLTCMRSGGNNDQDTASDITENL